MANIDAHAGTLRAALGASPLANPLNPPKRGEGVMTILNWGH